MSACVHDYAARSGTQNVMLWNSTTSQDGSKSEVSEAFHECRMPNGLKLSGAVGVRWSAWLGAGGWLRVADQPTTGNLQSSQRVRERERPRLPIAARV